MCESESNILNELTENEESKITVEFPADDFYEFIGNNEEPTPDFPDNELPKEDITSNEEKMTEGKRDTSAIDDNGKKNPCIFCGKCFLKKSHKQRHERIHTGEKPFECKFCEKRFVEKFNMKTHEMIHLDEKPFHCKTCLRAFTTLKLLKYHENVHRNKRPYKCKNCAKCYFYPSDLRRHEKSHST